MKKLLVIDGNSILNRAFYGIKALSNKKGVFTNAITGFLNIYLKLNAKFAPDAVAIAFDLKAPTFRHKLYDGYKANRHKMPDELAMQLPLIKEILVAMGIRVVEKEGFEADDILGTLSHSADLGGNLCIVATGDRDSFQLITENVAVNLAGNKEDVLYTPEKIKEVYGVTPCQMIEVKALMGDNSDNIPGVAGIGEKTALSLIQKYSTISNIYDNLDALEITTGVRNKLSSGKENAFLSKTLGTIALDAPIETNVDAYIPSPADEKKLAELFTELEMFSMLKKFNISTQAQNEAAASVRIRQEAEEICEKIELDKNAYDVIMLDGEIYACQYNKCQIIQEVDEKEFFENDSQKRTFNLKELWTRALQKGYEIKNAVFDTTLCAYLLDTSSSDYSFSRLCNTYSVPMYENYDQLAQSLFTLNEALFNALSRNSMTNVLTDIEIPLSRVLVNLEADGVALDSQSLKKFGEGLDEDIKTLTDEIHALSGHSFNIASPKQLGAVLFDELGLPFAKKTKSGYSTNAEVLESLVDKHPIIEKILSYRALTKLKSTYVEGLLKVVSDDGRIHTTFKQTETRTGRISSAEPNIQNIPVRTPLGKKMRKFFVARDGYTLVDADYSQIELRVLAHLSDDRLMKEAFINGDDIHAITASQVFNQPLEWVTPQMRSAAKAVNFGIVYGIGAFSLAKDINVSVAEAKRYIDAYLSKYSGVSYFMDKTVSGAKENGFIETMLGRKRFVPEINASNKIVQAAASRIAMNTPIQGTAADIIKIAMIKVYERLEKSKLPARLILQVHDELIVEAKEGCEAEVAQLLREEMENCVKLSIPLTVDIKTGKSWYDTH